MIEACSESIAHSSSGLMGYWLRGHEGEWNNCFSKSNFTGQKYRDKTTLAKNQKALTETRGKNSMIIKGFSRTVSSFFYEIL